MIQKKMVNAFTVIALSIVLLTSGATALVPLQQSVTNGINPFAHENARQTWEVDDDRLQCPWAEFTSIQPAIDAAADGDTILVYLGEYDENLNVNKEVALSGVSSPFPVINGGGGGDVIAVNHDDVSIETFEITGSTSGGTGVNITSYNNTYIFGCDINGNVNGIWTNRSKGDTFVHNWIHDNAYYGILCQRTNESFVLMNIVEFNSYSGVSLSRSCANSISDSNYIDNNDHHGVSLANASNNNEICDNSIIDNLLNGVLINRSQNITIAGNLIDSNEENGIMLNRSVNVTIRDNPSIFDNGRSVPLKNGVLPLKARQPAQETREGREQYLRLHINGILLVSSSYVSILRNPRIESNRFIGIFITFQSHHINISSNTVEDNGDDGIDCKEDPLRNYSDNPLWPNNVTIYKNTITGSTDEQIHIYSGTDIHIRNNTITDGSMTGITLDNHSGRNITVTGNTIERNGQGTGPWYAGILICAPLSVNISRNSICNSTREGIYIRSDSGSTENYHHIEGNTVGYNGWEGICIKVFASHHNTFRGNTVKYNRVHGIQILSSNNNTITNCRVYNNTQDGITLDDCTRTNITDCTVFNHPDNYGITVEDSSYITMRHCTVSNNTGLTAGGIGLSGSNDNQIINCTVVSIKGNGITVQLQSHRNTIINSTLLNNTIGVRLFSQCTLNTIRHCVIHGNRDAGVSIKAECDDNLIFDNHFNNTLNALTEDPLIEKWNITKTPGVNIIGGPFLGGNYWHDYTGKDTDGDGLGDTQLPYNCSGKITTKGDYHPLVPQQANRPPDKPSKPKGTTSGKIKTLYTYTTSTKDPNGDQVYYQWSWGDGTTSNWLGPFNSGAVASAQHTWTKKGSYQIKVKAKDTYGLESNWSDPLPVTMPLNNPFSIPPRLLQFLERLFERFPHAFPILRHLLMH